MQTRELANIYALDNYWYLRGIEVSEVSTKCELEQLDFKEGWRSNIVNWLKDQADCWKLDPGTIFIAMRSLDRYLARCSTVDKEKMRLIVTTCMVLASKFDDDNCMDGRNIKDEGEFDVEEFKHYERMVGNMIEWKLADPTVKTFLEGTFNFFSNSTRKTRKLAKYLTEFSMTEIELLKYKPSLVASAIISIARACLKLEPWPEELRCKTGYSKTELTMCMYEVQMSCRKVENDQYKYIKYIRRQLVNYRPSAYEQTLNKLSLINIDVDSLRSEYENHDLVSLHASVHSLHASVQSLHASVHSVEQPSVDSEPNSHKLTKSKPGKFARIRKFLRSLLCCSSSED